MINRKKLNPLTPIAIFMAGWLVKKSAKATKKMISKKRGPDAPVHKTEEIAWKLGIAIALAAAEALIKNLMQHEATDRSAKSDPVD